MRGVNLEKKLHAERILNPEAIVDQVQEILEKELSLEEKIIRDLYGNNKGDDFNKVEIDKLDPERIFTYDQIRSLCLKYRLRFLSTMYFKGDLPNEAVLKIKNDQKKLGVVFNNLKMVAPSKMFKLEDCDSDPLLFAKVAPNAFYLIHKWGNDLAWYRRIIAWPMERARNLFICILAISFVFTALVPREVLVNHPTLEEWPYRGMFFMNCLIIFTAITSLYAFMLYKNFTVSEWNKKYFN